MFAMRCLLAFLSLLSLATAHFGFFDQMFNSGGGGGGQPQQRNNPSDANHYRSQFDQCKYTVFPLSVSVYLIYG